MLISSGCCGKDEWTTQEFKQAGIQFEVPRLWDVQVRVAGQDPTPPQEVPVKLPALGTGAILTALPVLEDAAVVIIAPQAHVGPSTFAGQLRELVPLKNVAFTLQRAPWRMNNLQGIAFEGRGELPGNSTEIYFRSVIMDVKDRAVIFTLFSEASERAYYEGIFDRILSSLRWAEQGARPTAIPPHPMPSPDAASTTGSLPPPETIPTPPVAPTTTPIPTQSSDSVEPAKTGGGDALPEPQRSGVTDAERVPKTPPVPDNTEVLTPKSEVVGERNSATSAVPSPDPVLPSTEKSQPLKTSPSPKTSPTSTVPPATSDPSTSTSSAPAHTTPNTPAPPTP